jgi:hypothetical protein
MRKAVISASAFAVVAPLLLAGTASQANATTALSTCYAAGCTGHPAANYTCVNDAEVIYSVNIKSGSTVVGNLQLKYSPSCRATWARMISNLNYGGYAEIASNQNSTLEDECFASGGPGTGCNTNMIDDLDPLTSTAYAGVYTDPAADGLYAQTPAF